NRTLTSFPTRRSSDLKEDVNKVKIEVCRKYKSPFVPANSSILQLLSDDLRPRLRPVLTDKQIRGISGVTTVAVMPKPYGCPHGKDRKSTRLNSSHVSI